MMVSTNMSRKSVDLAYGADLSNINPIQEIEETSMLRPFQLGDVVGIIRDDDEEHADFGVVKFIERDDDINMLWLYIVANDISLNDKVDPKFPFKYWRIIENTNPGLFKAQLSDL